MEYIHKYLLYPLLAVVLIASPCYATYQFFPAVECTGGGNALDGIDGNEVVGKHEALADGDTGFVVTLATNTVCIYTLDADANEASSAETPCPIYVQPTTNPGTKSWVLSSITATGFAGALTGNVTGDCSGTAGLATTVTITDNESEAENNAVVFLPNGDLDGGNLGLESDGTFYYTPSTGVVTATGFTAAASATPKFTFNDSDAANGEATIFAQANGAFDTIMYLAVDVAGTETDFVELDGVTETIDLLKPVVITGNVGATTYGSDGSISNAELLTLDDCALTEAFVGGGAGSAPVCTTVTGTGAPVLATSPTLETPDIGVATGTSLALTGTLSGGVPTNTDADGMSQGEMTAAGLYGTMFFAGGAATWNLPAVGTGMSCCVYSTTAAAVVINPDDADRIVLNGTAKADGAALTSASAAGDFICLIADSAAGWTTLGRSGTWTAP